MLHSRENSGSGVISPITLSISNIFQFFLDINSTGVFYTFYIDIFTYFTFDEPFVLRNES